MTIDSKTFAAMLRQRGGRLSAAHVADLIDDLSAQAAAIETERDTCKAQLAEAQRVCTEVDAALAAMGLADVAVLTRARLRGVAGLSPPPDPAKVEEFKAMWLPKSPAA